MLLCTGSILSLVAVTVDRFWAIVRPLRYSGDMTRRRALVVIARATVVIFPGLGRPGPWWSSPGPRSLSPGAIVIIAQATVSCHTARALVVIARATVVISRGH